MKTDGWEELAEKVGKKLIEKFSPIYEDVEWFVNRIEYIIGGGFVAHILMDRYKSKNQKHESISIDQKNVPVPIDSFE